jgi:LysR family transcriptional activator of nhaA
VVLPARGTALREKLDRWFEANEVRPEVVAEAEDRALLNYLGQAGYGAIPAAAVIGAEISRQFNVQLIGWARGVRDQYYAVAAEHKLKHPAVAAVFATARDSFQVTENDLADDESPEPEPAAEL